jgi:xanthine/CO dehydrogenase XdhC/CoxF family maturation factor
LTLATIFDASTGVGEKIIVTQRVSSGLFFQCRTGNAVKDDLVQLFDTKKSEAKTFTTSQGEVEVFMELVQPSVSLIIFGGGFDARPVSQLAKSLGWDVQVTDECVAHIAPLFFPTADKLSFATGISLTGILKSHRLLPVC